MAKRQKNSQHNGQKKKYKRTNNDLQNIHIVYKAIVRQNSETMVNFEPKFNCKYDLSSSVCKWQNTFQQGVDIIRKTF
jgi:hypothetical protein